LLPEVENSSAEFVASLKNGVSKIQVPINVGCRGCEYRLVAPDISGDDRRNGFGECWGSLANEDPHILDYYHVSGIGGRNSPVVNALINRGRAKLSDVEESDLTRALMAHLGERGTFFIWSPHENTVLNTISRHMHRYRYSDPQLEKWLDTVTSREGHPSPFMVDMCELAKAGYFHPKMKGKLSLKYVLPAVWESDEALHANPAFSKYYQRSADGAVMNPYDTLP